MFFFFFVFLDLQSSDNSPINGLSPTQNIWHGNIETSTDTLVPIEQHQPNNLITSNTTLNNGHAKYMTDNDVNIGDQVSVSFYLLLFLCSSQIKN